jgi:hypothetical protein
MNEFLLIKGKRIKNKIKIKLEEGVKKWNYKILI